MQQRSEPPSPEAILLAWDDLLQRAREMTTRAYAPYSHFAVGAAGVVDDGRVVVGCNVENAVYGLGLCAECGLVADLHATGGGRLVQVAIVGPDGEPVPPCGRCRQLLLESGGPDTVVLTPAGSATLDELVPQAFGPHELRRSRP